MQGKDPPSLRRGEGGQISKEAGGEGLLYAFNGIALMQVFILEIDENSNLSYKKNMYNKNIICTA